MAMALPVTDNQASNVIIEEQKTPERPKEVEWVVASVEMVRKLGGGTDELWCSWDGTPQGYHAGYDPGQHGFYIDTVVSLQTALGAALCNRSAGEDLHRAFNFPGARGITIRATLKEQGAVYHFVPLARR